MNHARKETIIAADSSIKALLMCPFGKKIFDGKEVWSFQNIYYQTDYRA